VKKIHLCFLLLLCFQNVLFGACNPCGCNSGSADPGREIEIINWPEETPITLEMCCGDRISAEDLAWSLFGYVWMPYGSDEDKYTFSTWIQDEHCNCAPHEIISFPNDGVITEWAGSIDPCTSGVQTITAIFRNPVESKTVPGPVYCVERDEENNCTAWACEDEVPYTVIETKTRELAINVVTLPGGCNGPCSKGPSECAEGEVYNTDTCSCQTPAPPCPNPPCEAPCPNPPCGNNCPNPPCEPPCEDPPCEEECPNPPCEEDCPNPPCDGTNPPCPLGWYFDENLNQCVEGTPPPVECDEDPDDGKNEVWDPELGKCVCADENWQPISDEPCCDKEKDEECCEEECEGSCPTKSGLSGSGLFIKTPIGSGANGNKNLSLTLSDFSLHQNSATAKNLELKHGSYAKEILYDSNVAFRQILSGNRLVDIVTLSPYKFEIRQYDSANKGTKNVSGLYQAVGTPLQIVTIENPVVSSLPDYNRLVVTRQDAGSDPVIDEFYKSSYSGVLRLGQALDNVTGKFARVEFRESNWVSYGVEWIAIFTVADGDNNIASRTKKRYKVFPWGKEQIEEVIETGLPSHSGYVSTWEYYTNPAEAGRYSKLKQHIDKDGSWARYDYDASGREIKRVQPFKDSPATALDSEAHIFDTSRSTDPVTGIVTELVVEKILNMVVGRRYTLYNGNEETQIVCLSPTATQSDPTNLITKLTKFTEGPLRFQEKSSLKPDGTMSFTEYTYDGDILVVTKTTGEPNTAKTLITNGTRIVTRTNKGGVVVDSKTYDIGTNLQIYGSTVTEFDNLGRPVKTEYLDGTWERMVHACCNGADSKTDRMGITTTYTHDSLGRVLTETQNGITKHYAYDAEGRQLSVTRIGTDLSEVALETNTYDWSGELIATQDPQSYSTSYTHPDNNLLIEQQTLPNAGNIIKESYLNGNLKSISGTSSRPSATDYRVENNHLITRSIAGTTCSNCPNTEWVEVFADMAGRTVRKRYPDNAQELYYYNAKGQLYKSVDADGVATLIEYDNQGRPVKRVIDIDRDDQIDLAGADRITATGYSVVNDNGVVKVRQTESEWQENGQNLSVVIQTSDKSVTSLDSWTSKYGLVTHTSIAIDGLGGVIQTTINPDGSSLIEVKAGGRIVESKKLDNLSNQIVKTTYIYDSHGRVESETDARNGTTDYTYYNNDKVHTVTLPAADVSTPRQQTSYEYDLMGKLKKTILPDTTETHNEYFLTGDLKRTWGSQTYEQHYTYDTQGRRKTLTTEGSRTTTWNYHSARGWLESKLYDDGLGTSYDYTPGGRLHYRLWARGNDTIYSYNNAGELEQIDYQDTTADVTFSYNRRGLKATVSDAAGTRQFSYNAAGANAGETYSSGMFANLSTTTGYDQLLRPSYVDAYDTMSGFLNSYGYGYDGASRINRVSYQLGVDALYTYEYEPNSNLIKSLTFTDDYNEELVRTTRTHDKLARVKSLVTNRLSDNGVLASYDYDYNSLNQREKMATADNSYWNYGYDSLGQVTSGKKKLAGGTQISGYDFGYQIDGIGNRQTATANGKTQVYTTNDLNQYTERTVPGAVDVMGEADPASIVKVNGIIATRQGKHYYDEVTVNNAAQPVNQSIVVIENTGSSPEFLRDKDTYVPQTPENYTYDEDGNLLTDGRWSYTWDGENRLIGLESVPSAPASSKSKVSYIYDYMGRRVAKTDWLWNVSTSSWDYHNTRFFYYDGWNLMGEADNAGPLSTYVWGVDLSGTSQGAGGVGGLLIVNVSGVNQFAICDGNGNVMKLVGQGNGGTVEGEYEYGPFGEVLREEGAAKWNPIRFSSKYEDTESGMLYYGYRYYNSNFGSWINRDPINELAFATFDRNSHALHEKEEVSLYLMNYNDPINLIDSLGLCACRFKGSTGLLTIDSSCSGKISMWVIDENGGPAFGPSTGKPYKADGFHLDGDLYKIDGSTCVTIYCNSTGVSHLGVCVNLAVCIIKDGVSKVPDGTFGSPPREPAPGAVPPKVY